MLPRRISRLLIIVLALCAPRAAAQVRGTVVDAANVPVPGVSVFLTASLAHIIGRALSDARGAFHFAAVAPGRYRLRTMRIGFLPTHAPFFDVLAGQESVQRLMLRGARVRLDTVRVVSSALCAAVNDSSAVTSLMWEQARAALTATQITAADRQLRATTVGYERFFDPEQRVVSGQRVRVHADSARSPWSEASADSLHRAGYVATDKATNEIIFRAPGIEPLQSQAFIDDHCFRVAADSTDPTRIGLAFEPNTERRDIPEVKGTLWLDRSTTELRALQYGYVNAPVRLLNTARGAMAFARATNGSWIISAWNIRIPELGGVVVAGRRRASVSDPRVVGVKVLGGVFVFLFVFGVFVW